VTAAGAERIIVGTRAAHDGRALARAGHTPSPDPIAVRRAECRIPGDRLRASVTYEKPGPPVPT
jgi:hypothetical protein